jgi:hypothetical protein
MLLKLGLITRCFQKNRKGRTASALLCFSMVLPSSAAPLDVFLTATPESYASRGYIELGSDHMNGALDLFKVRESDPLTAGTKAGDYHGSYASGALRWGEGFWLSGALGQKTLSSSSDTFSYTHWQVSGLYRFIEPSTNFPAVAMRLSAWGNYAAATESTTAVVVPGAKLNSVKISDPADRQLQADVIGTWKLSQASDVSISLGAGRSQLSYSALSATTTRNGCDYQVAFTDNNFLLTRAAPCSLVSADYYFDKSGEYGVDVANEIAWRSTFIQAGVNGNWRKGPWTLMGGYLFHVVRRELVDDILASRGNTSYTQNHNIALEADYRVHPMLTVFARTQLTSNLLLSDLPVAYNSSTADRFGSKYTLFTVGLRANF